MFKIENSVKDLKKIKRYLLDNNPERIRLYLRKFSDSDSKELLSVAKAQLKARKLFDKGNKMFMNQEDLRFTTPQLIGDYRAERILKTLGRVKIADLFSGTGSQTISFSKSLKSVLAVEIDERKVKYAFKNMKIYDLRNVTLLKEDVFSEEVLNKIKEFKPKVIFADPQRVESGNREKEEEIFIKLYKRFSPISKNIIMEAPPFINIEHLRNKINADFEAEFMSVESNLRRLTLYFGELKKFRTSIIALPDKNYIGSNDNLTGIETTDKEDKILIELDEAFSKSGLFRVFLRDYKILDSGRNNILTGNKIVEDKQLKPFVQNYKVLFSKEYETNYDQQILDYLMKNNFKYVVLKQGFEPKDYWNIRKFYESKLINNENKLSYLFKLKNKLILCELITS